MKTIYLSALLAFFTVKSAMAQTNLISNGGFEETGENFPQGWEPTSTSGVTFSLVTGDGNFHEGIQGFQVAATSNSAKGAEQAFTGLVSDTEYTFSFWYKYVALPNRQNSGDGIRFSIAYDAINIEDPLNPIPSGFIGYIESPAEGLPIVEGIWLPAEFTGDTPPVSGSTWSVGDGSGTISVQVTRQPTVIFDAMQLVGEETMGTGEFSAKKMNIYTNEGNLYIATNGGESLRVYNLLGQEVASAVGNPAVTVISSLPQNQVLIVRDGSRSAKVIVKQ